MMWSLLKDRALYFVAKGIYDGYMLPYHNMQHIEDCYDYLYKSKAEYSLELDMAVLFHDIVYDILGNKEERSAKLLCECLLTEKVSSKKFDLKFLKKIIMATKDHRITDDSSYEEKAIIRADLSGFTNGQKMIENFNKLAKEAKLLYQWDHKTFAHESKKFLLGLSERIKDNKEKDETQKYDFWLDVEKGINQQIAVCGCF